MNSVGFMNNSSRINSLIELKVLLMYITNKLPVVLDHDAGVNVSMFHSMMLLLCLSKLPHR